jgi:hypothetical protein
VIAKTALGRAESRAVLNPIALENPNRTVIHDDGDGDGKFPLRPAQNFDEPILQAHLLGGRVEVAKRGVQKDVVGSPLNDTHRESLLDGLARDLPGDSSPRSGRNGFASAFTIPTDWIV